MAGFYPAPSPHYSGDLGTVFDYFSADGAKERQMGHEVKQQQLEWALKQAGLMQQSPDKYNGAQNPADFDYVNKAFGNQTERQNADTRAGDLKFRQDWAPDESARGWAGLGIGDKNAESSRLGAEASMMRSQTDRDYAPDQAARGWADNAVAQQNANTSQAHQQSQSAMAGDQSAVQWAEIAQRGKAAEENVMAHMIQFMPPEVAQTIAKMMAMKSVPGYEQIAQQEAAAKKQRADLLLGTGGGSGATDARDRAARGVEGQMNTPRNTSQAPGGTNLPRQGQGQGSNGGAGGSGIPFNPMQILGKEPPTPKQGPINEEQVYSRMRDMANPAKVKTHQEMGLPLPKDAGFSDPFAGLIDDGPLPAGYTGNIPGGPQQGQGQGQPQMQAKFIPGVGVVLVPAQ